jgi:hypothetical protein
MPRSKIPCLYCPSLVSSSNITHLCRSCYLLSLRLSKTSRAPSCTSTSPAPLVPPLNSNIQPPLPCSSSTIPPSPSNQSNRPLLDPTRSDLLQPRRYSRLPNFFDRISPDLLLYLSSFLQLTMHSYLLDPKFAHLFMRV